MASTIITKNGTGSAVPTSLQQGELAINVSSGQLYYGTSASGSMDASVSSSFTFTSVSASGFISASSFSGDGSGLTNVIATPPAGTISSSLQIFTALTASGNISASGTIEGERYLIQGNALANIAGSTIAFGYQNNIPIQIGRSANPINLVGQVTASGNISASGGITAPSFTGSFSGDATGLTGTPDITVGNITASGNISASGNVYGTRLFVQDLSLAKSGTNIVSFGTNNILAANITASSNISASGNVIANNFIGTNIQLVNHAWYSVYASADWGLDLLTNGDDNFGWADRVWDHAVNKSDVPDNGTISTSGTFTHQQFNKGFRINHNITDIELIGVLRPNSSVTKLNYYIYKGTPFNGTTDSTITFLASASSATAVTSRPNDIYITGSTGLQANKGDYIFVFANADLGSGNMKGSYTLTAKTRE